MNRVTYGVSAADLKVPNGGEADASEGIQRALDSGAPLVYIPYGIYRIDRGLKIGSGTRLEAHPQAQIVFGDGAGRCADDFLLSNRNPEKGDRDITISGGIWDGNNAHNPRGPEGRRDSYTGALINMKNVEGLILEDAVLKDSTAYFTRFTRVRNFRIERIRFQITKITRNQDGIHCCGFCENGQIHDIVATGRYTTGDDLVALNADDALLRSELLGAEAGPIRRVSISNIRAEDCHSLIRLASVCSEISDIDIRGVYGGCRLHALNADALRYCLLPLFDPKDPAFASGVGLLKNVRISDIEVYGTSGETTPLFCLESRMSGFALRRVARLPERDAHPARPLIGIRNVIQKRVSAEYRKSGKGEIPLLGRLQRMAGRPDWIHSANDGTPVTDWKLHAERLKALDVDDPLLRPLPEICCLRGFPP